MYTNVLILALGANLVSPAGGPRDTLEAALAALDADGFRIEARSNWYRTPAFPAGAGPDFVNGAAVVRTDLAPEAALGVLHAVERALGRVRRRRWAARACDLDLLACGDRTLPDAETVGRWMRLGREAQAEEAPGGLVLPHPRLHERGFVLRPMADVAADWVHPLLGLSVAQMLAALPAGELEGIKALPA